MTSVVKYEYDNNGNVITELVKSSKSGEADKFDKTEYEYDCHNRVVKETKYKTTTSSGNSAPEITQYYYDAVGNVLRMYTGLTSPLTINGLDNVTVGQDIDYSVTKYEYNYMGYLTKMISPMGYTEEYTDIDTLGNVLEKTDKNGDTISYTYNWQGQPESITADKDNNTISYEYNVLGLRTKMTDNSGITSYQYDSLGRLTKETKGDIEKNYTYDNAGNRTSFQLKDGNTVLMTNTYTYGWDNELFGISSTRGTNTDSVTYSRNGNGQTTEVNVGSKKTEYVYTIGGRVQSVTEKTNSNVKNNATYTYYANGNISTCAVTKSGGTYTNTYLYDGMNRLVSDVMTGTHTYQNTYTFDDYGNISTFGGKTYTYDSNNRLTNLDGTNKNIIFTYDNNGNRFANVVNTIGTSANADMELDTEITDESGLYEYDGFNRLIKVENEEGTIEYTYNGDGMRTEKDIDGTVTEYILDGGYVVAEIKGDDVITHVWGENLIVSDKADRSKVYYNHNAHGDIVSIQNSSGTILNEYVYDAYGNEINPDSTDTNPFRYCGEYYDNETGYIYLRNRYYDPSIGSFITEDPIRDGMNWYAYCGGNPVMFVDPLGEDAIIITNSNSVDVKATTLGHTSAIYQNDNGEWYYTYWGNKAAAVIRIPNTYIKKYRRNGDIIANSMASLSDFNNALNSFLSSNGFEDITSNYTDATYIVGDFTSSLDAAYADVRSAYPNGHNNGLLYELDDGSLVYQGQNSPYNASWNNCFDRTYASLSKGTLENGMNAGTYMKDLDLKGGVIPNNAISKFSEVFMNSSFTYSEAYSSLLNYAKLYKQGSPWAQKWEKANYANAVIG